ncbi:phosphotransferase family protein [Pedococcus sp. 2YAF34]|uniref:phosphotransferase family protein n=1 Tax=Pedococcus sp. 2YAF34 TaxID=3233032 RepID=UPI003F99A9F0
MTTTTTTTNTSWPTPVGVAALLDDVLHTDPAHPRPALRYLRRKPGRGLVAVYGDAREEMYTVTVDETAAAGHQTAAPGHEKATTGRVSAVSVTADPTYLADADGSVVHIDRLGVTIQRFPHDERLPGLEAAVHPVPGDPVWTALAAVLSADGSEEVELRAVSAVPLRYKPGDRCVLRYRLEGQGSAGGRFTGSVIGKLYRTVEQAHDATTLAERLWSLQGDRPWAPRPLGSVDPLPLVLTEDLGSASDTPPTVMGTEVVRMGAVSAHAAVEAAAAALADLHLGGTAQPETPQRTGAQEAVKAVNRAASIGRYVPELADRAAALGRAVRAALESSTPQGFRPSHGSYKPSQLLHRDGAVLLVDFDQFCLADQALDLGYFLAYLRPPGLWYHRAGTRAWFEDAAATFLTAYASAARARGMGQDELDGALRRSHVYEAALLLKIAARRPNRLHSARPGEVRALLEEVAACLDEGAAVDKASAGRQG